MKKLIIIFFLLTGVLYSQNTYYINDTCGTVPRRITVLDDGNFTANTFLTNKSYLTIMGTASGGIEFSFGDSLFTANNSFTWAADKPILHWLIWIPGLQNSGSSQMVWFRSASGSIDVNLTFRTQ